MPQHLRQRRTVDFGNDIQWDRHAADPRVCDLFIVSFVFYRNLLQISLVESDVMTNCSIRTIVAEEDTEIDIRASTITSTVIMKVSISPNWNNNKNKVIFSLAVGMVGECVW